MKRAWLVCLFFLSIWGFFSNVLAQYSNEYGTHLDDDLKLYCNRQTAYSTGVSDARKGLARKEDFARVCTVDRATLNAAYNTGYQYGLSNQFGLVVNEPAPYHPEIQNQLPSSYVQPYTRPVTVVSNPNAVVGGNGYVTTTPQGVITSPGGASSYDNQASRTPIHPTEVDVPTGDLAKPDPEHGLRSLIEISPSLKPKCIETPTGEACGFNCINSLNNVRCAASPDQVCRSNELGLIACGYNCISSPKTVRCALHPTDQCVADNNGNVFCGLNCRVERNAIGVCDIERYMPN